MKILKINTSDFGGGAEKIALDLHNAYIDLGLNSCLAVGFKQKFSKSIHKIRGNQNEKNKVSHIKIIRYLTRLSNFDWPAFLRWAGFEDIYYPKNKILHNSGQCHPDIIHAHNLHGSYFNLNSLIELSMSYPVLITLHDEWLITGHCAYTIDCYRWKSGCGHCPDLKRYPGINHDRTRINYKIKKNVLEKSKLSFATPSEWLLRQVGRTDLQPISQKVIPNGVNQKVYNPTYSGDPKKNLGFDSSKIIILYIASQGKYNPYKDYHTIKKSIEILSELISININFVSIGGNISETSYIKKIKIIEIPFIQDPALLAGYYQAADIFLHASLADNFPTTILEALSCGTPVVATDIGGISEQIIDQVTGFLVPPKDPVSMAAKIELLIQDHQLRKNMSINASRDAKERFSLDLMVKRYLDFYSELIDNWKQTKQDVKFP